MERIEKPGVEDEIDFLRRAGTIIVPGIDPIDRPVPERLIRPSMLRSPRRSRGLDLLRRIRSRPDRNVERSKATTHWLAAAELARRYPDIDVNPHVLYVDDGRILTSAGAAAGMDLCLHLVRRDLGAEIAAHTARMAVMPLERAGGQ